MIFLCVVMISCDEQEYEGAAAVTNLPTADFTVHADKYQAGQKIEFTDLSEDSDGFITTWEWDFGDSQTATDQSPEHFYQLGGTYNVKLIAVDNTGSKSEAFSREVLIADDPLANIDNGSSYI